MSMRLFLLLILVLPAFGSLAQVERRLNVPLGKLPFVQPKLKDSLRFKKDTLAVKKDSVRAPSGDIKSVIHYTADDSINVNLETRVAHLYGKAKVVYGTTELQAESIVIDYSKNTVSAQGRLDSLKKRIGYPIFKDGGQTYETREMEYNIKTKKAKIAGVVTQQGDGYLHGDAVFKNEKDELFCLNNAYTTCNLAHPHFRILARRTKAIPGDKMVTGPFYFEFNDVPMPLGFIFGIFPSQKKGASGILFPTYGEEGQRGFFLRQGGYFFDINDFIKIAIRGDVYSKGSNAAGIDMNYTKRYRYNGNMSFKFMNNVTVDQIEAPSSFKDFRLNWSHSPQSKGTGRFSASVNAGTSTLTKNNWLGLNSNLRNGNMLDQNSQNMSSNVSYSKTFRGTPLSLGLNMSHSQNLKTRDVSLQLPSMTLNLSNIYPFKNAEGNALKNLNFQYTMTGTNQVSNHITQFKDGVAKDSIAPFNFDNLPYFMRNAKKGIRHTIPLSTNFKVMRYFTMNTSFSYDEIWYFSKLKWKIDPTDKIIKVTDTIQGFNRIPTYSTSAGLNTRIYGTWINSNPKAKIRAIRHIINPSANLNYRPDFGEPKYGYFQNYEVPSTVKKRNEVIQKSVYEGYSYGGPSAGKSMGIGFGIGNSVEMKVRSAKDTVDKKISLLNSFSISGNYNFLADSMKFSTLSISGNTNVLNNKININFGATLDPYRWGLVETGQKDADDNPLYTYHRFDRLVWKDWNLGKITAATLSFNTSLNPKKREKENEIRDKVSKSNATEQDKAAILKNPDLYVDFSIPWNLNIGYSFNYMRGLDPKKPTPIVQSLTFSGDLSLSEKWKIQFNSGYDFATEQLSNTQLTLNRDLHCWSMSLSWVPFGPLQYYNFSIGVKSSLLSDLKLDRTRPPYSGFY